jgi:hypothetical protein
VFSSEIVWLISIWHLNKSVSMIFGKYSGSLE